MDTEDYSLYHEIFEEFLNQQTEDTNIPVVVTAADSEIFSDSEMEEEEAEEVLSLPELVVSKFITFTL